jgi:dihydrofolate reductase
MWVTVDGFIAGPKGEMDWVTKRFDATMGKYEDDLVSNADTLILGRVTYESFAGSWPTVPENPAVSEEEKAYARKLNDMRKIVFSKTLGSAAWNNSEVVGEIDPEAIKKLKQEPGKDILIYGSASIVQAFADLVLIDEYQLLVHPVILGSGKALFKKSAHTTDLNLLETNAYSSGVVLLRYQPEAK